MPNNFRIFLNDNIISHASQRGITRYFRKIVDGVVAKYPERTIVYSPETRDYGRAKYIRMPPRQSPKIRGIGFNTVLPIALDKWASVLAYRERASVVFSPYYGYVQTRTAQVYTVYDMIHELFPQDYPSNNRWTRQLIAAKRRCFERASLLIAISKNTAEDILSCYPYLDETKIVVIHLGVDSAFFEKTYSNLSDSGPPFFLYVGHRTANKNFLNLLTTFGQSGLAKQFDLRVISPLESGFDTAEIECVKKYDLQTKVHLINNVPETELRENYANAIAFVYPSHYEGFGLPILEAMASGTLVATSNISSMPEVGGDVAFYFDPHSTESIADCLRQIAYLSAEQRDHRVNQGIVRAEKFTWARCIKQTIAAIQSLS